MNQARAPRVLGVGAGRVEDVGSDDWLGALFVLPANVLAEFKRLHDAPAGDLAAVLVRDAVALARHALQRSIWAEHESEAARAALADGRVPLMIRCEGAKAILTAQHKLLDACLVLLRSRRLEEAAIVVQVCVVFRGAVRQLLS